MLFKESNTLYAEQVAKKIELFYKDVENPEKNSDIKTEAYRYYKAALQATNDRSSRIARGEIIRALIFSTVEM
jgi:hypothetical protein